MHKPGPSVPITYLDENDLLAAAEAFLGHQPQIRDFGLLTSALTRPGARMYGAEAYPDFTDKAAALLLSITSNHALVDGNKRLGWVALRLFAMLNGRDVHMPRDAAFQLVMDIAKGHEYEVSNVAARLAPYLTERL